MGWLSNVVNVLLPGVEESIEAVSNGELPIPTTLPLPLPEAWTHAVVPDQVENAWTEHVIGGNDKFRGLWNDGKKSVGDFFTGVGDIFEGDFTEGFGHIWDSAVRGGSAGIGAGLIDVRMTGASLQTLFGLEPVTRGLTPDERAALTAVFGDAIDLDKIRLKIGGAGIASINDNPFTSGNTIYMKKDPNNADDYPGLTAAQRQEAWLSTLVHEATHVWQFQNFGSSYQANSLFNQAFPPAVPHAATDHGTPLSTHDEYNWAAGQDEGRSWEQLNVEQQAALIEFAYEKNFFADPTATFTDDQGNDRTAYIREAMRKMRERVG